MGSLMSSTGDPVEEDKNGMRKLLVRELAQLHHTKDSHIKSLEGLGKLIDGCWIDHFSHDWTHDPNCVGLDQAFSLKDC